MLILDMRQGYACGRQSHNIHMHAPAPSSGDELIPNIAVNARLAAEWRPSASSPRLNGRRSARLAYIATTWRVVVVGGRVRWCCRGIYSSAVMLLQAFRLQRGIRSRCRADLELRHFLKPPTGRANCTVDTNDIDHPQDIVGRKNIFTSRQHSLPIHTSTTFSSCSLPPRPSIDIVSDCLDMAWQ